MPTAGATKETAARIHGTVRVSLPAKVAYNPDSLKKTIGSLLGRLGCPGCFSGADCIFTAERDFVVDPEGIFSRLELNPQPLPPAPAPVTVSLASANRFNIDKVFNAVDAAIATIGACPCHSGFDVAYLNEVQVIGIDEEGQAQQYGG